MWGSLMLAPKRTKFLTTIKGEFSSVDIPNLANCKNLELSTATDTVIEGAWVTKTICCQASDCNGSVQPTTPVLGRCTKCRMAQKLATCGEKMWARILVTNNDEHLYLPMQLVATITGEMQLDDPETVEELLLSATPFDFRIDASTNAITFVTNT